MSAELMFFSERCIAYGNCLSACPNQAITLKDVSCEVSRVHPHQSIVLKDRRQESKGVREIHTAREKCIACARVSRGALRVPGKLGRIATVDELVREIMKDVIFYDSSGGGVTFSGGEPLLQPDFLLTLLKECKEKEIHTAVDTCGFVRWETLSMIVPYTDLILYDLKCIDAGLHFELTGRRNEIILENLIHLYNTDTSVTVRFPLIPGINDNNEIIAMGEFLSSLGGKDMARRVDILPYHKMGADKYVRLGRVCTMPDILRPTDKMVRSVRERLSMFGLETGTRG